MSTDEDRRATNQITKKAFVNTNSVIKRGD